MRAYIKLWGNEYSIRSISWYPEGGGVANVSFTDENGVFQVVHVKAFDFEPDAEHNRSGELLYSNFDESIVWKEK